MTTLPRLWHCGRSIQAVTDFVGVHVDDGVAHFTGVQSCGSVWACAPCSAVKREEHAERIQRWSTAALLAGFEIEYAVLTMPHRGDARLDALLDAGSKAWGLVTTSRGWRAANVVGCVRSWEITDGIPNGWHPHVNALIVHEPGRTDDQRQGFADYVRRTWADAIEKSSGSRPSDEHGVRIKRVTLRNGQADVAEYMTKIQDGFDTEPKPGWGIGREMARGDVKAAGRLNPRARRWSPFALAERAGLGDDQAKARWWEYERATFGRRCVEESRSARWKAFMAGLDLVDDQALDDDSCPPAAGAGDDTQRSTAVVELSPAEWQLVTRYAGQLHMLRSAEAGGAVACLAYLAALRRRQVLDDKAAIRRKIPRPALSRDEIRVALELATAATRNG